MLRFMLATVLVSALSSSARGTDPQGSLDDTILERGEKLLGEAKGAYEEARSKNSAAGFVEAGFKLEEARIKYVVLQEIGSPEKQKIATDRLRAVNQLAKLIHDGKVAVTGTPAEVPAPEPKPEAPTLPALPAAPKPEPAKDAPDVTRRAPVPDAAKQQEAEKMIRDVFKDQYAKKAPGDRRALSRSLLENAAKSQDDPAAFWVLCREAQDAACQTCDVRTALEAVESLARIFDVDSLMLRNAAIASAGKAAKSPEDFAEVATALLQLIEELIAVDQYEAADKDCAAAVQYAQRSKDVKLAYESATRSKEVTEAKTLYQGMKSVLQTLAKNPEDAGANLEMGKFLCFAKGGWDLGLRFLTKGSDASLKALAEKDLSGSLQPADRAGVADGWFDLGEKEKSPLRRSRVLAHCKVLYDSALLDAPALLRLKIEKRLDALETGGGGAPGPVNLLSLIDLRRAQVCGEFRKEGDSLITPAGSPFARVEVPYQPPAEYDVAITIVRRSGSNSFIVGLIADGTRFNVMFDAGVMGDGTYLDATDPQDRAGQTTVTKGKFLETGKPAALLINVRKALLTVSVNGRKMIVWKGDYKRLGFDGGWSTPNSSAMILGSWSTEFQLTKAVVTPVTGQGRRLR